jgi:hypothetical protein
MLDSSILNSTSEMNEGGSTYFGGTLDWLDQVCKKILKQIQILGGVYRKITINCSEAKLASNLVLPLHVQFNSV